MHIRINSSFEEQFKEHFLAVITWCEYSLCIVQVLRMMCVYQELPRVLLPVVGSFRGGEEGVQAAAA